MLIIQVMWKTEWVGGLTLETHPASKTRTACANASSASACSLKRWLRLKHERGEAVHCGFTCAGVLLLLPFSPLLLALLGGKKEQNKIPQRHESGSAADVTESLKIPHRGWK